jgi:hypothetical protein
MPDSTFEYPVLDDRFQCPVCGGESVMYHVGRNHWCVCDRCRVRWKEGENLFSAWRDMTEEQVEANIEVLKTYAWVDSDGRLIPEGDRDNVKREIAQIWRVVKGLNLNWYETKRREAMVSALREMADMIEKMEPPKWVCVSSATGEATPEQDGQEERLPF